jgi:hypothetical protein
MKRSSLILFFLLFASSAHAEQYLCIADKSVGFEFNKVEKSWDSANFNVEGQKYIIPKSKLEPIEYEVNFLSK